MICPKGGLDTGLFSNILALAWTLLLPARSLKGRLYNHFTIMEFKEEVLLEDVFADDDSDDDTDEFVPTKTDDDEDDEPEIDEIGLDEEVED